MSMTIAVACITLLWMIAAVPLMRVLSKLWKLERVNFKGTKIPAGFGFLIFITVLPMYAGMSLIAWTETKIVVVFVAVFGFGIIGLIDDIYGTREVGGFKGHLGLLKKGRMSTGLIKAVVGGLLGLGLGIYIAKFNPANGLVNGLVICLTANTLNLLDLRPGRAVSCFWLGIITLGLASRFSDILWIILIPVFVPAIWLTIQDRSAKIMLGDAGSNVLGAVLGLVCVYELGLPAKIAIIAFFVIVHLYAEKYSISEMIERNRFLRRIDRLLGER